MERALTGAAGGVRPARGGFVLASFAAALFVSATLVFSVQPLAARMVLPALGGSPAVWNAAMVFFQGALLIGYLYAHVLVTHVPHRFQAALHMGVLALGALFLPLAVETGGLEGASPSLGVIMLFAGGLGLPFVALSANAPLLQSWFSRTGHKDAGDPYFLYGASNLGSVLALLAYPVIIEPFLSLRGQTEAWAAGYVVLAMLLYVAHRHVGATGSKIAEPAGATADDGSTAPARPIAMATRLRWIVAAAIPSSLMLGVTTHLTTNVAAAPFLWVLPLVLYLATFMLVFERRKRLPWTPIVLVHAVLLGAVLLFETSFRSNLVLLTLIHLALFFVATLICHGDLARRRPAASGLTGFYFCMSLGGVLGGATTALIAPVVFAGVWEYPLMLAATCLLVPAATRETLRGWARPIGATLVVLALMVLAERLTGATHALAALAVTAVTALLALSRHAPLRYAAAAVLAIATSTVVLGWVGEFREHRVLSMERSFFGQHVTRVALHDKGLLHAYYHGDTLHNTQLRAPEHRREPLAYYAREGTFADAVRAVRAIDATPRIAVIGLGAGAMACHARRGETWTFYEIDPVVIRLARDLSRFSYVSDCAPDARIVQGDARLTIAREPAGRFDLIMLDAFSSDSVPGHLLTQEALRTYRKLLSKDGFLFVHTSNRFTDVSSVAIAGGEALGWSTRYGHFQPDDETPLKELKAASTAVVMGPETSVARVAGLANWRPMRAHPLVKPWTDDFSNVLSALLAFQAGGPRPLQLKRID